jgi:hypothetical protein
MCHKTKRNTPQPHPPTTSNIEHSTLNKGCGRCISRCSRPLSRSQTTTPHPHPTAPQGVPARAGEPAPAARRHQALPVLKPQTHPAPAGLTGQPTRGSRLILQNPNSVPPPPRRRPPPGSRRPRRTSRPRGAGRCRCSTAKQHQPPPHEPVRGLRTDGDGPVCRAP